MSFLSPIAPSHTVCISEVQGETHVGLTIASNGPHSGTSFSTQPVSFSFFIANPLNVAIKSLNSLFYQLDFG